MIVGTPIALGDGSYQFQQDDGEPLVLRGEAAQRAHAEAQGAPPSALPPPIDPSIVEAAKPPPDRRLAENEPTDEFSLIREQGMRPPPSLPDTRGSFAKGLDKVAFGLPETPKEVPRDIGDIDADQPQPKAARGSGPGKGVFYTPPAAQDPNAGLRYVKGGLTPHTRTEQGSLPMSDANEAATKMADQGRYEAAEGTANVAIQRAAEEARVRGEMATASMAEEARQQAAETERRQAVEKRLARIDKMGQDAANEKIDPEHYWVDKSAAFKFETSLFAGLSAFAASRSGGKAYAVDSMNDAIERDAKAQTANLDNKRKSIAQETNFLGELRNEYKDRDQALAAFRLAKQGTFLAKLDEIIASNVPAEQKAKLEETRAAIVAQRQEQRNALGKVDYAAQSVNVPGGLVGGPTKKDEEEAKAYGSSIEGAKLNEAEASLVNVEKSLAEHRGESKVPGIGPENVAKRAVKGVADWAGGEGSGDKLVYNEDERANRQKLEYLKAGIRNAITGAGMSNEERVRLDAMIQGASNYSDIANTVKIAREKISAHKASLAGGYRPEAVRLYEQRKRAAQGTQGPSVKVRPAGEE